MKLEDIGFYTLSDHRASRASLFSPMWRGEILLGDRCNFKCPYCRGFSGFAENCRGDIDLSDAYYTLGLWGNDGLKNVRFSGGEPTLYDGLDGLVIYCERTGVEHIAVSTNGSQPFKAYKRLVDYGVNDFSISLDACCALFGDKMSGVPGAWRCVVDNIEKISEIAYVTVGVVLTEETAHTAVDVVKFAHELGVADIRIVSAAQYNQVVDGVENIPQYLLDAHPILRYRVNNFLRGRNVRGIGVSDCHKCHLVKDDSAVAGRWHFPCIIYLREGGNAIGEVGVRMRQERMEWFSTHDSYLDPICRKNCLDVCIDYNNQCQEFVDSGGKLNW